MGDTRVRADGKPVPKPPGPRSSGSSAGGGGGGGDGGSDEPTIYAPISGGTTKIGSPYGQKNHGSPPHTHMGIDVPTPVGTRCVAPTDGKIGRFAQTSGFQVGGMVHFVFTEDTGKIKAGTIIGWGHVNKLGPGIKPGAKVKANQTIGYSNHSAPHVHFIRRTDDSNMDGNADPTALFKALQKGKTVPVDGSGDSGGGDADVEGIAKATAFSTFLNLPGILDQAESLALTGERSLMNDQPLLPFIQQLAQASLRSFQSMPNGNFYAFCPDYFGGLSKRTPYWEIDDIEIIDGTIQLSDESLATHVYTVGDTVGFDGQVDYRDKMFTAGVVTIFSAFQADFINGLPVVPKEGTKTKEREKIEQTYEQALGDKPNLREKENANAFIRKYGARPYFEEAPMVRSPFYEAFLAYQRFMLLWSRQFLTEFTTTFMPELYPGGIVGFPNHGIQCYIDEVEHTCSYADGFVTRVLLSAPAPFGARPVPNASVGMIRPNPKGSKK